MYIMKSERKTYLLVEGNFLFYESKVVLIDEVKWGCTKHGCNDWIYKLGEKERHVVRKKVHTTILLYYQLRCGKKLLMLVPKTKVESNITKTLSKIIHLLTEHMKQLESEWSSSMRKTIIGPEEKYFPRYQDMFKIHITFNWMCVCKNRCKRYLQVNDGGISCSCDKYLQFLCDSEIMYTDGISVLCKTIIHSSYLQKWKLCTSGFLYFEQ